MKDIIDISSFKKTTKWRLETNYWDAHIDEIDKGGYVWYFCVGGSVVSSGAEKSLCVAVSELQKRLSSFKADEKMEEGEYNLIL